MHADTNYEPLKITCFKIYIFGLIVFFFINVRVDHIGDRQFYPAHSKTYAIAT